MKFELGDQVVALDEDLSGTICKIDGTAIDIALEDGFVMTFQASELLKIANEKAFKSNIFSEHSFSEVLSEKAQQKRHKSVKVKPKDRHQPQMVVDLHLHKLISDERHMSSHDKLTLQLDTAKRQLDFAISKRIQKIVFIHGVGEGVLKMELETIFGRYDNIKFYDADFKKYGLGAMEVYIFQNG